MNRAFRTGSRAAGSRAFGICRPSSSSLATTREYRPRPWESGYDTIELLAVSHIGSWRANSASTLQRSTAGSAENTDRAAAICEWSRHSFRRPANGSLWATGTAARRGHHATFAARRLGFVLLVPPATVVENLRRADRVPQAWLDTYQTRQIQTGEKKPPVVAEPVPALVPAPRRVASFKKSKSA